MDDGEGAIRRARRRARVAASGAKARRSGRTATGKAASAASLGLPDGSHLAIRADGDVLYRLVREDQATVYSFQSRALKGRGKLPEGDANLHTGISMFDSPEAAVSRGGRYPSYVAEVKIPAGLAIHVAKTLGRGHYSVWADPRILTDLAGDSGHKA